LCLERPGRKEASPPAAGTKVDSSMVKHSTTVGVEVELKARRPERPFTLEPDPFPSNVAPSVHVQRR
jgi:hypothetical protein